LNSIGVRQIAWSREGLLWVSTDVGVSQFDGKRFRNFGPKDGLAVDTYAGGSVAANGDTWFVSHYHGLYRYDGSKFQNFRPPKEFPPPDWQQLDATPEGVIWVAGRGDLVRFNGTDFIGVGREAGLDVGISFWPKVASDGAVWFGSHPRGLWRYAPAAPGKTSKAFFNLTTTNGLLSDRVRYVEVAPDGVLWLGTGGGVVRFDGKTLINYTPRDGLGLSDVGRVYRCPDGALWFGGGYSGSHGVSRYDANGLQNFNTADGIAAGVGASLTAQDGSLWF